MKLATLRNNSRDGELVLVSANNQSCTPVYIDQFARLTTGMEAIAAIMSMQRDHV